MAQAGTVKWFNETKGYGFIQRPVGPDVYVHYSAIEMEGFRTLKPGMKVEFELGGSHNEPRARKVSPMG